MSTAEGAASYIHEGLWHDWSKPAVLGLTLTVNAYHASIISPAIAIFVAVAGSQLWRLFQFGLHQYRASGRPSDFLYHQQQVVLRNTGADLNTIWRLLRLGIAWRHQKDIPVLRKSIPLLFWSLLHFVIVIVASVLSTWILSAGNRALSRSPFCGTFNQTYFATVYSANVSDPEVPRLAMEYAAYINERWAAVQQHVDICSTSVEGCDIGTGQDLTYSSRLMPGSCPFGGDVCHPDIDGAMSFDTGYLSSMDHLGINAPEKDRISFRFTAQCAPLNDAKYTTGWQSVPADDESSTSKISDAMYGIGATSARNATYSITELNVTCDQRATMQPYSLDAQYAAAGGSIEEASATFNPISELQIADADVSLLLLSFNNAYNGPVSDPWFAASTPYNDSNAFCLEQDKVFYLRDRPLTGLGCTQQWQVCNTTKDSDLDNGHCTPAMGMYQLDNLMFGGTELQDLVFSPAQLALISRFDQVAVRSSYYFTAYALSKATSPPLKARNLISTTAGLPLPATQWQEETKYWTDILLSYLQQSWLDFSTGQFSPRTEYINMTGPVKHHDHIDPIDVAASEICANQIVQTTTYRNFNFFALITTFVLGTIIIVLGLSIEDVIGTIRQRQLNYTDSNGKQDMWIQNSDIEMLKTISELKGNAIWSKSRNGIPLAGAGAKASISDLRAEDYDVDLEKGLVTPSVKRQRTGLSRTSTRDGPSQSGQDGKTCVACDIFEVSRSSSGISTPTAAITPLTYHNDFSRNIETPPVPRINTSFQVQRPVFSKLGQRAQARGFGNGYLVQ